MPDRKPSPEAELASEIKGAALEAATQVLSGIAAARKVGEQLRERYAKDVEQKLGVRLADAPALGDLVYSTARLHTEHLKAILGFQRWFSDALTSGLQNLTAPSASAAVNPDATPAFELTGALGSTVSQSFEILNPTPESAELGGYTRLKPTSGVAFYADWVRVSPAQLAPMASAKVEVSFALDARKFTTGTYQGETVLEFKNGALVKRPFKLVVSAAS